MKGVAGIISFDLSPATASIAERMAAVLHDRGRGLRREVHPAPGISLWQVGQGCPSQRPGGAVVVDGFFYNRPELTNRLALPLKSHQSDILFSLWEQAGARGLNLINGDFAAAVFDQFGRRLVLCRDRFGVRNLFYTRIGRDVIFASEIKALAGHPGFRAEPEPSALFDYLATHYRYIHRDPQRTYFRDIRQVPAAHAVVIDEYGERPIRYWDLELDPEAAGLDRDEAGQRLLELMRDSTARRLDTDLSCCFSVSSGMDSSSVCSLAVEHLGAPQPIYSVGYGGGEYDESEGIAPLARTKASSWRRLELERPPLMETVEDMVRRSDGPVCTVTWLAHRSLVAAAAEDGFDIVFSGLGGDECLAGEYEHFFYFFADLKAAGMLDRLDAEIDAWIRLHDHPVFRKSRAVVDDAFRRLIDWNNPGRVLLDQVRYRRYFEDFEPDFVLEGRRTPDMAFPFSGYLANRCYQDLFYETTPPSLAADGANAAAFGLSSAFRSWTTGWWNSAIRCPEKSSTTAASPRLSGAGPCTASCRKPICRTRSRQASTRRSTPGWPGRTATIRSTWCPPAPFANAAGSNRAGRKSSSVNTFPAARTT